MVEINLENIIRDNEKTYSKIPVLNFSNKDYENLYWNAFSLIRQCIMPPEGASSYNYYVFSREPKWGWGYGGQVFHESLVMLAYAYMDSESAMNSQRVYMERQWPNGYINYRTGPYLDEQIAHNGDFTSSAPWYNYQNYEIFKITGDKKFLEEAYSSGKKFYKYYSSRRDSNENGLSEWGAHAVLESVRDGQVAVWDRVGWPSNFEGPDINAMMVMEAKALASMAQELQYHDEEKEWDLISENRRKLINRYLWDNRTGFYYNVDKNDLDFSFKNKDDLKIKEIIGFLPLWAGVATKKQANELLKAMKDPNEFWRPFGIPTLTAKDEYYNPIGYWNGPIWIQWQYLVFRGLLDYGYVDEAVELAERVMDNIIHQLKVDHNFWEFYSADDYQAGWHKTYIWTGIVARMLIDLDQID
jgi:glycogen debranching enzyme